MKRRKIETFDSKCTSTKSNYIHFKSEIFREKKN